jgi:hypothetical protein
MPSGLLALLTPAGHASGRGAGGAWVPRAPGGREGVGMTAKKQLKARIRARMARTGERYSTARRHVVGDRPAARVDAGYTLRGGVHPDSAALANVLAHRGVTAGHTGEPVTEALVFGAGGGIGAGYILWEFTAHDARVLTLGFRPQWQYSERWAIGTLQRLGVPADVHETGGAKGATARLDAALAAGSPVLVWPDRYHVGYWHLPEHLDGFGGHPVVAYAAAGDRVHVDDRTLAPLTVPRERLEAARARVGSYRNVLVEPRPAAGVLPADRLRAAALDGLVACVELLGGSSASFALPAWRKWSRLMTDRRNAKGWPRVFADRGGLVGALLSAWEGVEPIGMTGGHLRGLFADFLDEAADLLGVPELGAVADDVREVAAGWHRLAETALPVSVPVFAELRALTAAVQESITGAGDEGRDEAAAAAAALWTLRSEHDRRAPLDDAAVDALFAAMGDRLRELHSAESAVVARLRALVG